MLTDKWRKEPVLKWCKFDHLAQSATGKVCWEKDELSTAN